MSETVGKSKSVFVLKELLIVLFVWASLISFAQDQYHFEHLSTSDGLLANDVYAVHIDRRGFLWIGSKGGLQRFDGYDFVNYTYDPQAGMMESTVRHIIETSSGEIWAGIQGGGITRIRNGQFLPPLYHEAGNDNSLADNYVESLVEDSVGGIWIATKQGLDHYLNGKITHHKHDPENDSSISDNSVYAVHIDGKGRLWVGTQVGLNLYLGEGKFRRLYHDPTVATSISGNFIHGITSDENDNIWLAIVQGGVSRLDPTDFSSLSIRHDPTNVNSIGNDIVLDLKYDFEEEVMWVATWGGGLNKIDGEKVTRYTHTFGDNSTILSDNIEEILIDDQGSLWIATFGGGLSRYAKKRIKGYLYRDFKDVGMLPTSSLRSVITTEDGSIWMATHLGVNRIKDGKIETYIHDRKDDLRGLSSPRVVVLYEDSKGRIWLGYLQAGADMIENGSITRFLYDPEKEGGIGHDEIMAICEDDKGNIWLGSNINGISVYDGVGFSYFRHDPEDPTSLSSNLISGIFKGKDGAMWISTLGGGLSVYRNGSFKSYQPDGTEWSIPRNKLTSVVEDGEGQIWVSYRGGVARLDLKTDRFFKYDHKDGLGDLIVEDLEIDGEGLVWAATNSGASQYLPDFDAFKNYNTEDGLINEQVAKVSYDRWGDRIFFATPAGYFILESSVLPVNKPQPKFLITRFSLIEQGTNSDRDVSQGQPIRLAHDENSFVIKYSSLSGELAPKDQYAYRMKPLDEDWVFAGTNNEKSYTYLNPGTYEFEVRLASALEAPEVRSMIIEIRPPWWGTWWFRLLVICSLVLSVLLFVKWRHYRIGQQKARLEQEVLRKTKELREAQARLVESEKMASVGFLTAGIAHEVNNPLNFIHGSTSALKKFLSKSLPEKEHDYGPLIDSLELGMTRVQDIVKSLNRFNRRGSGMREKCNVHDVIDNCLTMIQNKTKDRISIVKSYTSDPYVLIGQEGELHQAFLNVLVNATQAIKGEGKISIRTRISAESYIIIEIADTGVGIAPEDLKKVTTPFFTTKDPGEGTGLGTSIASRILHDHSGTIEYQSQKQHGTNVVITLPVQRAD